MAILAGRSRTALQKLEDTLATSAPSEALKPFVGNALTLATQEARIDGQKAALALQRLNYGNSRNWISVSAPVIYSATGEILPLEVSPRPH